MNELGQNQELPSFTRSTLPDPGSYPHRFAVVEEASGARSLWMVVGGRSWKVYGQFDPATGLYKFGDTVFDAPGLEQLNGTDITVTRALALADFGAGLIRLNAAGVIALTLPTVAALALPATPGAVRKLRFLVAGAGIPTFAGATAGTSINGVAGATTVLPLGGAPVSGGIYTLTQRSVGADVWTLQ